MEPAEPNAKKLAQDGQWLTSEAANESFMAMQEAFRQVGPLIVERAGTVAHTDKLDGSPVTDTDVEVEKTIFEIMERRFPGLPVFGEESGYGDDLPDAFWLVDPIDGTNSFIQNEPNYTSMAVFIQNKEAVAAVIYNPSTDAMYTAQKGKGAYKNGTRLDLQTVPLPRTALCKERFVDELSDMLAPKGVVCEPAPQGGGHGFTMVLDGLAAARFQLWGGGYTHDYAPGALLVQEARGVILPILQDAYTYESRSFVACHPELASTVRSHIERLRSLELLNDKKQ